MPRKKAVAKVPAAKKIIGVNPFGKLHDYICLTTRDDGFEVSDGTHSMLITEVRISQSSNRSKPFLLRGKQSEMLLTFKQAEKIFSEYLRFMKRETVTDDEITVEYEK